MPATILLVDDDRGFREATKRFLEAARVVRVVGEAANGEEAVRLARELRPDVVLMDISMPDVDGLEATRRIKAERPNVKVVVLTVHDEVAYRRAAGDSGADALVVKKALAAELLPTIRELTGDGGSGAGSFAPGHSRPPQHPSTA